MQMPPPPGHQATRSFRKNHGRELNGFGVEASNVFGNKSGVYIYNIIYI